jgi:hypothetical protein
MVAQVLTMLDYGSATLTGIPTYQLRQLRSVPNAEAWLVFIAERQEHVTPLVNHVNWLHAWERIKYGRSRLQMSSVTLPSLHWQCAHGTIYHRRNVIVDSQYFQVKPYSPTYLPVCFPSHSSPFPLHCVKCLRCTYLYSWNSLYECNCLNCKLCWIWRWFSISKHGKCCWSSNIRWCRFFTD